MVPLAHPSPHPKQHLDRFSCFCRAHGCDRPTDWQTEAPRYSVCNNRPHLHCSGMQHNNKLCNIVVTDGTNQWHGYQWYLYVHLYQSTNFLNAPLITHSLAVYNLTTHLAVCCVIIIDSICAFSVSMQSFMLAHVSTGNCLQQRQFSPKLCLCLVWSKFSLLWFYDELCLVYLI